jgi:NAD(P) transhydrogenase
MIDHFDLVVIGSGPAGEKGAAQAAYFGKRVCIIERAPKPGGAAVNTGVIPAHTLRETALYFSGRRQRGVYGVEYHLKQDLTLADFMFRERSVVEAEWTQIDENLRRHEITSVQGSASFIESTTVEVSRYGQEPRLISGDHFLIATGSRPLPPEGLTVDGRIIVDSATVLTLDRIPGSIIVIGGGVVGCQYASIFAALGVRVTLLCQRARLLTHVDAEISEALSQQLTARHGVSVHCGAEVTNIAVEDDHARVTLSDGTELRGDCLLYAAGRCGNTVGLGLEQVGVHENERGFVHVDEYYRTAVPHIYAAGDVIGFPALASTSMEQARIAVCHAFDLRYKQRLATVVPYSVWTIPEIATVGETEEALLSQGIPFEVGRASFRQNPRGQILGELDGFVKLIFHPDDQRLLGVSIIGEGACELIHIGMSCMAFGGTIDFFIQSVFAFPSLADVYKYAAYDGLQALTRRYARRKGLPSSQTTRRVATR